MVAIQLLNISKQDFMKHLLDEGDVTRIDIDNIAI